MSRILIVVTATLSSLLAQQPKTAALDARAFVPTDPRSEIFVDFRAMRDSGVWDGVTSSIARTVLPLLEQQLGFHLDAVDRLRAYPQNGPGQEGRNDTGVVLFEGSADLVTPAGAPDTATTTVAGHEVVVVSSGWAPDDPTWWVAPKPGVLVYGSKHLVEPALLGKGTPGVTPPELLSLVAGRGVLAHAVVTFDDTARAGFIEAVEARGIAPPEFLMLCVRIVPGEKPDDEPVVHVDGKLRWPTAEQGPQQMTDHLKARIELLKKHPRFGALRRIWNLIELRTDGRDLTAHIELGRPRDAGGLVAVAAPFLMFAGSATVGPEVQATTADPAPPAPPVPVPAVPEGGNRGGGGDGGGATPGGSGPGGSRRPGG